ncbi:aba 3 [Fusarium mundagurra]|uniref:Aba 3 n=1 Tax=Fusarium mundagurra TaxID=1567541 RepID=A0A8H5Z1I0_9HYPO|nr:aba 3 [Fusarium mundagurra]
MTNIVNNKTEGSNEYHSDANVSKEKWYFPPELRNGLNPFDLSNDTVAETLACAWEYARCVIPDWKNWDRYLAFNRTIVIAITAEFRGDLIPKVDGKDIIGYDLDELLSTLFGGTSMREDMAREFRTFFAHCWFRLRDCDALARYTMASALACNGFSDMPFDEKQLQLVAELSDTLYDAVAFYKHRAESETNSTFGYIGDEMRVENYRDYRDILWALDVTWAQDPAKRCVLNFVRPFGGPIHMMTRRYRFVEDGLMIGKPETGQVVELTRANFKLWNKVEGDATKSAKDERNMEIIMQSDKLMIPGFCSLLESSAEKGCSHCGSAVSSSPGIRPFRGVRLCDECKTEWRLFMRAARVRFAAAFPEIKDNVLG